MILQVWKDSETKTQNPVLNFLGLGVICYIAIYIWYVKHGINMEKSYTIMCYKAILKHFG